MLGSVPIAANGVSAMTVTTLAPGSHGITAAYGGDTDDAASNSTSITETITQIATVTALSSDASVLNAGATLHLTAIVTLAAGATADGALTGSVTFRDGSAVVGIVSIDVNGQAVLALGTLSVGSHSLTASFAGNINYAPSNSSPVSQTVQQAATQTTVSSASTTMSLCVPSTSNTSIGRNSLSDRSALMGSVPASGYG